MTKSQMPIFMSSAYFRITFLVLNDANVKEGYVIKLSHEKSILVSSVQCFSR